MGVRGFGGWHFVLSKSKQRHFVAELVWLGVFDCELNVRAPRSRFETLVCPSGAVCFSKQRRFVTAILVVCAHSGVANERFHAGVGTVARAFCLSARQNYFTRCEVAEYHVLTLRGAHIAVHIMGCMYLNVQTNVIAWAAHIAFHGLTTRVHCSTGLKKHNFGGVTL